MRLTMHVGTKKTATSTLQHMLGRLKPDLAVNGVLFPATTDVHQRLARSLIAAAEGDRKMNRVMQATLEVLADEVDARGPGQVFLSSEHLISAPPHAVARLRDALHRRLPGLREVVILCYVREPVGFATSMIQQDLKNGKLRLAEALAEPWPYRLADWVATWAECFGPESLRLRRFDPGHLVGGSILGDVLEVIGLPGLAPAGPLPRMNSALSAEAVQVADALMALRPEALRLARLRGPYKRLLRKIDGHRFVLPEDVQERVIAASRPELEALQARWGLEIPARRDDTPPGPALTEDEARARAVAMIAAVEA